MKKLTRLTLGSIHNLVDGFIISGDSRIVEVGRGTIKGNRWKRHHLKLTTPEETRKIRIPIEIINSYRNGFYKDHFYRNEFLEYIDGVLRDNKMYFANVEYTNKWSGFLLRQLSGIFYKESKEAERALEQEAQLIENRKAHLEFDDGVRIYS